VLVGLEPTVPVGETKTSLQNPMNRSQQRLAAALAVVWLGGVTATQAATTLQDLINGASIRVFDPVNHPGAQNDLTFSNFQNVSTIGTLSVPYNQIFVVPIWGGVGGLQVEPGLRFQSALWTLTGPGQTYDLSFEFTVSHTFLSPVLTDNTLSLTGATLGSGIAQVAEGVINPINTQTLANKYVFTDAIGNQLVDHDTFTGGPYSSVQIRKDFLMSTGAAQDARVFVSDFDQTFSTVPEASPGLAGIGLALLAGRQILRRRATGGVDTLAV
jgi:hypothetical protein